MVPKFGSAPERLENASEFLECVRNFSPCSMQDLLPCAAEIRDIVEDFADTGTGPDGIPYSAYALFPTLTVGLVLSFLSLLCSAAVQAARHCHPGPVRAVV